jgi:alpha-methylacyl-CoA racemase
MTGPLDGVRIVELAGLGPAPFAGMVLADMGAEVIRVDRADRASGGHDSSSRYDLMNRGKKSVAVDLRQPEGVEVGLRLVDRSDVLIEGFRPGVAERMGLGPGPCSDRNPRLVYGRMTGWGQEGPLASSAGHDIDYIAVSGVLGSIGTADEPVPPLNLVGDFGGGGMLLVVGILAALHAVKSGEGGVVVDAAMVDGSALLMTSHHGYMAEGWWSPQRAVNPFDGAAPWYTTYRTSDGGRMAVGAIEPHFYSELIRVLELDPDGLPDQNDRSGWPELRRVFADRFAGRTRTEWEEAFLGVDACVAPVLDMAEAARHPYLEERRTFVEVDGVVQPAPAPRFSGFDRVEVVPPPYPGQHTDAVLESLGYCQDEIGKLKGSRTVA